MSSSSDVPETLELVDSGHDAATDRTDQDTDELWAVVENSGDLDTVTVELRLRNEFDVLARHRRTDEVPSEETRVFRFIVTVPSSFDQYVFRIIDCENASHDRSDEPT